VISSLEKRVKLRDDRIAAFEKRPAEHKEPTAAVAAGPKLPSTKPSAIPTEIERRIKTIDALYTALETSANETLVAAREYQPGKDHFPPAQEAMRAQVPILDVFTLKANDTLRQFEDVKRPYPQNQYTDLWPLVEEHNLVTLIRMAPKLQRCRTGDVTELGRLLLRPRLQGVPAPLNPRLRHLKMGSLMCA
jgi:hypothetical protein